MIRTYTELSRIPTFEGRFSYLRIGGQVGQDTFGFDRHINQKFYGSREWRDIRRAVIIRDEGCDLGARGHEIGGSVFVHHINPIRPDDIVHSSDLILAPEYLITVSFDTHNAIHYGDISLLRTPYKPRTPGDTKLW